MVTVMRHSELKITADGRRYIPAYLYIYQPYLNLYFARVARRYEIYLTEDNRSLFAYGDEKFMQIRRSVRLLNFTSRDYRERSNRVRSGISGKARGAMLIEDFYL